MPSPRSPLSKTPKHVIFLCYQHFVIFYQLYNTIIKILLFLFNVNFFNFFNLRDVTSLRYSSLPDLPEDDGRSGRALEIHTTQRIWLISCNDGDDIFDTWVTHISKAANKKPKRTSIQQESKSGKKKKTMPRRPSFEEETRMNHLKKQFGTR